MNFNLAVYSATVNNSIVDGEVEEDLVYQVSHNFYDHYCLVRSDQKWKSHTTLFGIWIGINE